LRGQAENYKDDRKSAVNLSLNRSRDDPKTATRILSDEQLADYAPWFDNHKRLRELIAELEDLSLAIAEADPRWNR
jgi:hypothetical protein